MADLVDTVSLGGTAHLSVFDAFTGAYIHAGRVPEKGAPILVRDKGIYPHSPPSAESTLLETSDSGDGFQRRVVHLLPCDDGHVIALVRRFDTAETAYEYILFDQTLRDVQVHNDEGAYAGMQQNNGATPLTFSMWWLDEEMVSLGGNCARERQFGVAVTANNLYMPLFFQIFRYIAIFKGRGMHLERYVVATLDVPPAIVDALEMASLVNNTLAIQCRRGTSPRDVILTLTGDTFHQHKLTVAVLLIELPEHNPDTSASHLHQLAVRVLACWSALPGIDRAHDVTSALSYETGLRVTMVEGHRDHRGGMNARFHAMEYGASLPPLQTGEGRVNEVRAIWQVPPARTLRLLNRVPPPLTYGYTPPRAVVEARVGLAPWARGIALVRWRQTCERWHTMADGSSLPIEMFYDSRVVVYRFPWTRQLHPLLPEWYRVTVRTLLLLRAALSSRSVASAGAGAGIETLTGLETSAGDGDRPPQYWEALPNELMELMIATLFEEFLIWNGVPTREGLMTLEANGEPIILWPSVQRELAREEEEAAPQLTEEPASQWSCAMM